MTVDGAKVAKDGKSATIEISVHNLAVGQLLDQTNYVVSLIIDDKDATTSKSVTAKTATGVDGKNQSGTVTQTLVVTAVAHNVTITVLLSGGGGGKITSKKTNITFIQLK